VSIVSIPELVVSRPRPDRLCFVTPPNDQTWATESQLVRAHVDGRFVVLTGSFHLYASGNESKTERRLAFSTEEIAESACAAINAAIRLPRIPLKVTEAELRADPAKFNRAHVEVVGTWSANFESSSCVGAYFKPPKERDEREPFSKRILARGFWSAGGPTGYGHRGGYSAELCAYEMIELAGKTFQMEGADVSFEQNDERDEWRVCANGNPVAMTYKGEIAEWLPLGGCVRAKEPFRAKRSVASCLWSAGSVDVQGTVVYMMEEVTLMFSADRKQAVVSIRDASDTSQ
jgi:hypothetical protein